MVEGGRALRELAGCATEGGAGRLGRRGRLVWARTLWRSSVRRYATHHSPPVFASAASMRARRFTYRRDSAKEVLLSLRATRTRA